jgi:hypothetical protein
MAVSLKHRRLCRVKNMLAMYLKYHKARLTPTTPVTSIVISPVKMSIGCKSLTNLRSEMIFLQGKPVFYIFLPSTPPYWQILLRFCWQWTPKWQQSESRSRAFSNIWFPTATPFNAGNGSTLGNQSIHPVAYFYK